MLRVEDESSDGRRNSERGERCLICDNRWGVKKKLIDLLRWPSRCAPRTWINRAVILLSLFNVAVANYASDIGTDINGDGHFTRQWAVHIEGGQEVASRIAAKHGFINLGKVTAF
ncbi:hypothetical protein RUM44_005805 [Polyplax serrata]|uniref:Peptidase S8 pro-domain domain-containing protein n=1 Tax=Polyplax serrata TaxID=468196 RepID=A0ABR1AY46_POLSC